MTETGKASDQNLTEEAYAQSIGKAGVMKPIPIPSREMFVYNWRQTHPKYPMEPSQWTRDAQRRYDQLLEEHLREMDRYLDWMNGYLRWRRQQQKLLNSGNNGTQLGPREFTFTYGEHFADPEEAKRVMSQAIDRLTRYYKDEIIEFHAVGEYTQAGRPHIHGWYHLENGLKITDKNFKRAYPPWNPKKKLGRGFEGGHHATITRVSDFHGYTEKHLEEAWLVKDITNNADDPSFS